MTSGETGIAYAIGIFYLVLHLLIYVAKLRYLSSFKTERGIFLYHLISFLLFTIVCLVGYTTVPSGATIATALGLVAMHGVYSTSFLELWSLAQGSYSISIITGSEAGTSLTREELVAEFARIGDEKKGNRLSALVRLSLIERSGDSWQLTRWGHLLASVLAGLLWIVDVKNAG